MLVLGVNNYGVKDSVNLNNYKKTGTLLARANCTNTPNNSIWWNVSIIGEQNGSCTQIASMYTSSTSIAENLGYTYIRTYKFDQDVWSDWRDITTCRKGKYVCGQYEGTTAYELYDALDAKTTFTAEINEGGVHYFITGYKLSDLYGGFLKCCYFGNLVTYFWKYNGNWHSSTLLSE